MNRDSCHVANQHCKAAANFDERWRPPCGECFACGQAVCTAPGCSLLTTTYRAAKAGAFVSATTAPTCEAPRIGRTCSAVWTPPSRVRRATQSGHGKLPPDGRCPMAADRAAILTALRGAPPCKRHPACMVDGPCADCDEARADAVLAAIRTAGVLPVRPPPATRAPARLRCDACAWVEQAAFDDIPSWDGKPCPACGKGLPIGDADMEAWQGIVQLEQAGLARPVVPGEPTADGYVRLHVDTARLRPAPPAPPDCGHPAACATTPDNPPRDGSTWTCAWCAEVAAWQRVGEVADRRDAALRAEADREHAAELVPAQARERALRAGIIHEAAELIRWACGLDEPQPHVKQTGRAWWTGHVDAIRRAGIRLRDLHDKTPANTAALDAALRKARADALRTCADAVEAFADLAPRRAGACLRLLANAADEGLDLAKHAARLRCVADDADADPTHVASAVDAAKERRAGLDERICYPDKDR